MSTISLPAKDLAQSNIEALEEGLELLGMLTQKHYTKGLNPTFQSTIGAHFRHALEHYVCFFKQVSGAVISYDQRQRNQRLEEDLNYARQILRDLCAQLRRLDAHLGSRPANNDLVISDEPLSGAINTTIERELLFLLSHTVHHYAIIAAMARMQGKCPQKDFGVAIATQTYQAGCDVTAVPLSNQR